MPVASSIRLKQLREQRWAIVNVRLRGEAPPPRRHRISRPRRRRRGPFGRPRADPFHAREDESGPLSGARARRRRPRVAAVAARLTASSTPWSTRAAISPRSFAPLRSSSRAARGTTSSSPRSRSTRTPRCSRKTRRPGRPEDPQSRDLNRDYGGLKTLSEEAVESAFPDAALVIRPGLIVGAHDYSGRFSYWPRRVARGGQVLAPGRPETRIWLIDVRDLAEWTIRLAEERVTGVFNAAGPASRLTMGELLEECRAATASDARFTWVDDEFLVEREVVPYTELPLWVPGGDGGYPAIDISKARCSGPDVQADRRHDPGRSRRGRDSRGKRPLRLDAACSRARPRSRAIAARRLAGRAAARCLASRRTRRRSRALRRGSRSPRRALRV